MIGRIDSLPCALCARLLKQRADKNGKPYFVCDDCGTQLFVRGANGRARLTQLLRQPATSPINLSRQIFQNELNRLQGYIEVFCEDEQIVPPGSGQIEDAVPFAEWSGQICDRISEELNRCANRK